MPTSTSLEPFTVAVADAQLDDLRRRLESARWPAELDELGRKLLGLDAWHERTR